MGVEGGAIAVGEETVVLVVVVLVVVVEI